MPNLIPGILIFMMWALPLTLAALPMVLLPSENIALKVLALLLVSPIFCLSFVLLAGVLSRPAQKKIIRGKFPREPFHKVYFWRRIYGCCWTTIFYFKPLYHVLLSIPLLKELTFRLFGYKGPVNFVIYPDTWVRDLPLLYFGEKSYCSNRSTIGSNICLMDGTILVDKIHVGRKSIVGHLTMIAPGVKLEDEVELGVACAVGIRCRMKEKVRVGAACAINHGVVVGARSELGGHCSIGLRVEIGDDIKVPPGAMLPAGAIVKHQSEMDQYISTENQNLKSHASEMAHTLKSGLETVTLNE